MKKIMIYEDDFGIRGVMSILLQKQGYQVKVCSEVDDFVCDNTLDYNPDLIIMDISIPVLGGEAAIKLLKNNPATRKIPVMVFSSVYEAKAIANKLNVAVFVPKPFDSSELVEKINDILRHSPQVENK